MTLSLNGSELDITLENETTVGQVLEAVDRWLEEKRESLGQVILDGVNIPADQLEAACSRELTEQTCLELRSSSWSKLFRAALSAADDFLSQFSRLSGTPEERRSLWLSLPASSFLRFREPALAALIEKALEPAPSSYTDGASAGMSQTDQEALRSVLARRIAEIDDPQAAAAKLPAALLSMADRLEQLPLELQTGKDRLVASTLKDFADLAAELLRLRQLSRDQGIDWDARDSEHRSVPETLEELNDTLRELISAYENDDVVLVGDLAEYEVAPRLRALANLISQD